MSRVDKSTVGFSLCWTVLTAAGRVLEGGHGWQGSEMVAEGDEKDWDSLENGRGKDRNGDKKRRLVAT